MIELENSAECLGVEKMLSRCGRARIYRCWKHCLFAVSGNAFWFLFFLAGRIGPFIWVLIGFFVFSARAVVVAAVLFLAKQR
jgi:hypothetical protein